MIPILHLHDIQAVHDANLDTAQQVRALLLFRRHLQSNGAGHDDVAVHQFLLVGRHHHHPPGFSSELDSESEIVIAVPSEIDQMIYGVRCSGRRSSQGILSVGRQGEGRHERTEILDLRSAGSEREEMSGEVVQSQGAER